MCMVLWWSCDSSLRTQGSDLRCIFNVCLSVMSVRHRSHRPCCFFTCAASSSAPKTINPGQNWQCMCVDMWVSRSASEYVSICKGNCGRPACAAPNPHIHITGHARHRTKVTYKRSLLLHLRLAFYGYVICMHADSCGER